MGRRPKQTFFQRRQRPTNTWKDAHHHSLVEKCKSKLQWGITSPRPSINKSTNKCGEKGTLLHCWWGCKLIQPLWRTAWRLLKKLKTELLYDPAIPLLGIVVSRENHNAKRHMHASVHHSTVYNSQGMEATWMSIGWWMDKNVVVHIHNAVLPAAKQNAFESVLMRWMKLEPIIQSEVSQKEKH